MKTTILDVERPALPGPTSLPLEDREYICIEARIRVLPSRLAGIGSETQVQVLIFRGAEADPRRAR